MTPPTPGPQTPSLATAARELLYTLARLAGCRVWTDPTQPQHIRHLLPGGVAVAPESCPVCSIRRALAAEEEREKLRREAAEVVRRAPVVGLHPNPDAQHALELDDAALAALRDWAEAEFPETSR